MNGLKLAIKYAALIGPINELPNRLYEAVKEAIDVSVKTHILCLKLQGRDHEEAERHIKEFVEDLLRDL